MENYDIFSFPFTYSATHSLIVPHKENDYVLGLRLPRVAVVLFAALISYLTFVMRFHVPTTTRQPRAPVNVNFFGRPCTLKSTPSSITWTGLESFIGEFPLRASQAYYTRHSKVTIVYHASPYLASQFMS